MRRLLLWGLAAVLVLALATTGLAAWLWSRAGVDTAGAVEFATPLAIPPLAESRRDEQGRRVFRLEAREGTSEFRPGVHTPTWGFNGDLLGPTLRARRGETVRVEVRNALPETTTVHWHGMRLPARMDGGPHQPVPPGGTWAPEWEVDQPAATLWYHPHPHDATEAHVYRGLAGLFLLDDDTTDRLSLPRVYGVDDVPVVVQDARFTGDGRLDETAGLVSPTGLLGDTVLVNGTVGPYLHVSTELVRLRLLNASPARVYDFGFDDDRPFALVGTDGGLLPAPYETRRVQLSPGERAEVVVSVRSGDRPVLRSYPPDLGTDPFTDRFAGGDDTLDVLQLRAAASLRASPPVPATLAPALDQREPAAERRFELRGRSINGETMDMGRIDAVATKGTTEVWQVANEDGGPHNFHVHGVPFQVLSVDGRRPPGHLSGWKDTVFLPPGRVVRLALEFRDHADPETPYMFHCHLLRHEDRGMMGQFVVVEPGHPAGQHGGRDAGSSPPPQHSASSHVRV